MATQNLMAATSLLPKILASTRLAGTAAVTVYTCPANSAAMIKHGTICNTSGSPVTVSVSVIPSGGAADGTHVVISGYALAAFDTLPLREYLDGCCLGPGDMIVVTPSTTNVICVVLTGTESS